MAKKPHNITPPKPVSIAQAINEYQNLKDKLSPYFPGILLFFISLVVALVVYKDYGMAWDEPAQRGPGLMSFNYIFHGNPELFNTASDHHGTGFELVLIIIEKWLRLTDTRDIYLMRHLATHIFFLISALSFYVLVYKLFRSRFLACLGFAMLVLAPRIYAHSYFNSKDLPFLSMVIISLTCFQLAFRSNKKWQFFILGLLCGYATSIRIMGIMLGAFIFMFLVIDLVAGLKKKVNAKEGIFKILLFSLGFCFLLFISWPYLWRNPVNNFMESLSSFSHFEYAGNVLLNGVFIKATDLPWTYFPTWFLISNQLLWLLLGFAGILLLLWEFIKKTARFIQNTRERNFLFYLLCFLVPVFMVIVMDSVIYDDWRHLYFVYPPFILLSLYFLDKILLWLSSSPNKMKILLAVRSLCIVQVVVIGFFMVRDHPFQQVYFNSLVSHSKESLCRNYDLEYWGCGFMQALNHLVSTNKSDSIKVCSNYPAPLGNNIGMLPEKDRKRIFFLFPAQSAMADYYITNFRGYGFEDFPPNEVVYSVSVENSTILSILKLKKDTNLLLAQNYEQLKKYDSAIFCFNKIPSYGPNYFNAQLAIANAYFMMQNLDSAAAHFSHALQIKIDDPDALNGLGCVYFNRKEYPQAIDQFKRSLAINTNNLTTYSNLGRTYFFTQQYDEAIDIFKKELALDPKNLIDVPTLVACYRKTENTDSAVKYEGMIKR